MPQRRPRPRLARDRPTGYLWFYPSTGSRLSNRIRLGPPDEKRGEISAVGDLNGDGYPDLLAVKKYTANLHFYPRQALLR